jgi:hypothetical protein
MKIRLVWTLVGIVVALAPLGVLAHRLGTFEHLAKIGKVTVAKSIAILDSTAIHIAERAIAGGEFVSVRSLIGRKSAYIPSQLCGGKDCYIAPRDILVRDLWENGDWLPIYYGSLSEPCNHNVISRCQTIIFPFKGKYLIVTPKVLDIIGGKAEIRPKLSMFSFCGDPNLSLRSISAPFGFSDCPNSLGDGTACLNCGPYTSQKESPSNGGVKPCGDGRPFGVSDMLFIALLVAMGGSFVCFVKGLNRGSDTLVFIGGGAAAIGGFILAWLVISHFAASENASASLGSCGVPATTYSRAKDVGVIPIVIAKFELRNIERQIFATDLVISPDDAALDERPEALNCIRMDCTNDVFANAMVNGLMPEAIVQPVVFSRALSVALAAPQREPAVFRMREARLLIGQA